MHRSRHSGIISTDLNHDAFTTSLGLAIAGGAATLGFTGLRRFWDTANRATGYGELIPDPQNLLDLPKDFAIRSCLERVIRRQTDSSFPVHRTAWPPSLLPTAKPFSYGITSYPRMLSIEARSVPITSGVNCSTPLLSMTKLGGLGGTTTVVYDTGSQKLERQYLSLTGTVRNCAGGRTPWNSWISCEETVLKIDEKHARDHGFNFEVPSKAQGLVQPVPLKAMGRFNHEAVAVDSTTGIVYQTEDRGDS